ncbi:MAG: hypothetical protein JW795_13220 [Chitinivibrionales bacterium]|nr:hypothetical protein [Chitinivibrionales bacterium]
MKFIGFFVEISATELSEIPHVPASPVLGVAVHGNGSSIAEFPTWFSCRMVSAVFPPVAAKVVATSVVPIMWAGCKRGVHAILT